MKELFPVINPEDKKFLYALIAAVIIAALILQVLLYLKGFYSISADESGRTLLAFHWLHGTEPPGEPWLPFHKIITATALKINPDLFRTPRISGTVFALFSIAFFICYSHELFRSRQITLLASIAGLLFPPFVIIRAVPLAESMYIFFIISGSLFFLRWVRQQRNISLIAASLLFALSSSVRYEGWLFSLCMFIYLFFQNKYISLRIISFNSLILAAFPLYWIISNYFNYEDPLYFIKSTSEGYRLHHTTFLMLLKYNLVTQFIYQNILYLNAGALISVVFLSFVRKEIRIFILFLLSVFILLAALSLAEIGMPSHAFWRIPLAWSILLIPFSVHFIITLSEFLSEYLKKKKEFIITIIFPVIFIYFLFQVQRLSNRSMFTEDEKNAGEYLVHECIDDKRHKILIDSSGWEYVNVITASNHPYLFIPNAGEIPYLPKNPVVNTDEKLNTRKIKELKIKCLIFERDDYKNYLDKNNQVRSEKRFGKWKIYTLK